MKMFLFKLSISGLLLSACTSTESTVVTTVAPSSSTTVVTTTTLPSTTTSTLPPLTNSTSTTSIPEAEVPRAKFAVDACEFPKGSQYCVWGTEPLDLVVNNSRIADVQQRVVQSFTAASNEVSMVELPLQTSDIGELVLIDRLQAEQLPCLSVHLTSESGYRIASAVYRDAGGTGRQQRVEVPLVAKLRVGKKYNIRIEKEPACAARSLAIRIAMSSLWKYPKAFGELSVDSRTSIGSLWARIN